MNRGQVAAFMLRWHFGQNYVPPVRSHIFQDDWTKGPGRKAGPRACGVRVSGRVSTNPPKYCPWTIPREA